MTEPTPTVRTLIEDATRSLDAALALASALPAPMPDPEPSRDVPWALLLELVEAVSGSTLTLRTLANLVTDYGIQVQGWRAAPEWLAPNEPPTADALADFVADALDRALTEAERARVGQVFAAWFPVPQE